LFIWPLPGPYNILFYDLYPIAGLLFLTFGLYLLLDFRDFRYFGFISLLFGFSTIIYGIYRYILNLTRIPLIFFLLYFFTGLSAVLTYPFFIYLHTRKRKQINILFISDIFNNIWSTIFIYRIILCIFSFNFPSIKNF
jgi:putative membrane protein